MKRSAIVVVIALNLGVLLSTVAATTPVAVATTATATDANPYSDSAQDSSFPGLASMLKSVLPAVVNIRVEGTQAEQQIRPRALFGPDRPNNQPRERPFQSQGSGVIIDAQKGFVLTNSHIVSNANKISGSLYDGREFDAILIGRDEQSDIALLQLKKASNLVAIPIAGSDTLRVGDFTVAVGNPFGLGQTATIGIISALGRSGLNAEGLENYIQTDAAINRGNSGGPLVNLHGELIGINTAILASRGGNIGIAFAVPSSMAKNLAQQLIEYGEVRRGVLGIKGSEMSADIASVFNLNVQKGGFVREVATGSAAAKAGIKAGDVITHFNGKLIGSFAELRARIATTGPKEVNIGLMRTGHPLTLKVTLQQNESSVNAATLIPALQGVNLVNKETPQGKQGIVIDTIVKNSPAEQYNLRPGDKIIAINSQSVENIAQLRQILQNKPAVIALSIQRNGEIFYLILR